MLETLLSVGIDVGTATTQVHVSRLALEDTGRNGAAPSVRIASKETLHSGKTHFTPLLSESWINDVAPLIDAKVVCLLIGERPGLASAESMSAYIAFRPNFERPESWRSVISNIHGGGAPPG